MHKVLKPFSCFFFYFFFRSIQYVLPNHTVFIDLFLSAFFLSELQGFDSTRNDSSLGLNDCTSNNAAAILRHYRVLTCSSSSLGCQNVLLERICIQLSYCKHPVQSSVGSGCLSDQPVIRNDSFPISCHKIYHHHILLLHFLPLRWESLSFRQEIDSTFKYVSAGPGIFCWFVGGDAAC